MMKRLPIISLILLLGLALLITACGSSAQPVAQAAAPPEDVSTPVEVATVETGDIALVFSYAGDLQPKDSVSIIPGANGRVEALLVEVGDEVLAGDPIAIIESDRYAAQLEQAEAALASARLKLAEMELGSRPEEIAAAQAAVEVARAALNDVANIDDNERTTAAANLAQAEAALRKAQTEYDKIAWAGDVGATSQAVDLERATIAYETALSAYNLQTNPSDSQLAPLMAQLTQAELKLALTKQPFRQINFEQARLAVRQADAAVKLARLQLDEVTIEAPFDGGVAELYINPGSTVGPQGPVALFISQALEVTIDVEENRIGQLSIGQYTALQTPAYPGVDFPAVVTSIAPLADKDTHTFTLKVTPADQKELLRGGMSANVSILAQEKQNAVLASRAAVIRLNDQNVVYVVKGDAVEQRTVTTGLADADRIEILSGLEPGDTVVIAGQPNLTDGAKIEVVTSLNILR